VKLVVVVIAVLLSATAGAWAGSLDFTAKQSFGTPEIEGHPGADYGIEWRDLIRIGQSL
jgi:hypothetical protein